MSAKTSQLEQPECVCGYPVEQLKRILGDRYPAFCEWAAGSTGAICEGRRYNHDTRESEPTHCGPHGFTTYPWDVEQFLQGGRQLD